MAAPAVVPLEEVRQRKEAATAAAARAGAKERNLSREMAEAQEAMAAAMAEGDMDVSSRAPSALLLSSRTVLVRCSPSRAVRPSHFSLAEKLRGWQGVREALAGVAQLESSLAEHKERRAELDAAATAAIEALAAAEATAVEAAAEAATVTIEDVSAATVGLTVADSDG